MQFATPEDYASVVGLPQSRLPCRLLHPPRTKAPSLLRRYPISSVLRASPPPHHAQSVRHRPPVGRALDHMIGLPVLRALSLCTCCRHYPGAVTGTLHRSFFPVLSAFPDMAVGSACASSFSRLAQRSLKLRPAHSRCHQFVTRFTQRLQPFRYLHSCSGCFRLERVAGWGFHPLKSAALSRRTPIAVIATNCPITI
jgi:hypothetical protein